MYKLFKACAISLAISFSSLAADYSEYATMPTGFNDAISFDPQGNLYVSYSGDFGATGLLGTKVRKITPKGNISNLSTKFNGPLGNRIDSNGNMYVSNYNTGTVTKITANGKQSILADLGDAGFAGGIVINKQDEIFVSSYSANMIHKLSPSGNKAIWLQDNRLKGSEGIAIDEANNIYVGNYDNGLIFKIDTNKNITKVAKAPDGFGYITYVNGMIYGTARNKNKIFKVSVSGGNVEVLAGSDTAGFNFPNGITPSADGSKLFVSNYQNNKIIMIENFSENSTRSK